MIEEMHEQAEEFAPVRPLAVAVIEQMVQVFFADGGGPVDDELVQPLPVRMHGGKILGRSIRDVNTVNGARVTLEDGAWVLVRASSNKPELVVVVESMTSDDDMKALFREEVKPRLGKFAEVGKYNQEI